eukprot:TRINITY_DN3599_c0_g1_i12.p2 TRINITY_DN3599_c0_g1~~TRINITY_DN3599_c0_g1_i12.p2  ORF type:complete len:199 (-),score=-8.59 TRINITY_DN3599_c0_g1_i12:550-1146(-)
MFQKKYPTIPQSYLFQLSRYHTNPIQPNYITKPSKRQIAKHTLLNNYATVFTIPRNHPNIQNQNVYQLGKLSVKLKYLFDTHTYEQHGENHYRVGHMYACQERRAYFFPQMKTNQLTMKLINSSVTLKPQSKQIIIIYFRNIIEVQLYNLHTLIQHHGHNSIFIVPLQKLPSLPLKFSPYHHNSSSLSSRDDCLDVLL